MYHYIEVKGALNNVWWMVGPEFRSYDDVTEYLDTVLEGIGNYRIASYPESILISYPFCDDDEC